MTDQRIIADIARLQQQHWPRFWPGQDLDAMAADVVARLGEAVDAWALSDLKVLKGGVVGLVLSARREGIAVVVKVSPRGHEGEGQLAAEGRVLDFWRPSGAAVALLDSRDGGHTLLLEKLYPGYALDDAAMSWESKLREIGRLAGRLHSIAGPPTDIIHLRDYGPRSSSLPRRERKQLEQLLRPRADDVLLHGDLHTDNVLRHQGRWKVIDPHGIRGDRHADIWVLLSPQAPVLAADPLATRETVRRWLTSYAEAAGMDIGRAATWTRLRALAELSDRSDRGDAPTAWTTQLERLVAALDKSLF